jgi:hypothetical protein
MLRTIGLRRGQNLGYQAMGFDTSREKLEVYQTMHHLVLSADGFKCDATKVDG